MRCLFFVVFPDRYIHILIARTDAGMENDKKIEISVIPLSFQRIPNNGLKDSFYSRPMTQISHRANKYPVHILGIIRIKRFSFAESDFIVYPSE